MPEVTPICQFGTKAISFSLKGIDEKTYNLEEIKGKNGTLVIFICNIVLMLRELLIDWLKIL